MLIIGGKRYCGKTTELIKISSTNQIPIIVLNNERGRAIKGIAKRSGMEIPEPIIYKNLEKCIGKYNEILIDDVEDILQDLFWKTRIVAISTSIPFKPMESIKDKTYLS